MVDTTARDDRPATILESALRYDRAPAVVPLIVLPLGSVVHSVGVSSTALCAWAALVAFEKLTPLGAQGARISGLLLIAAALWMFER
jgi:hypothetical protein